MTCGADMNNMDPPAASTDPVDPLQDELTKIVSDSSSPGRLIIDGKVLTVVDNSQRLVGRADLREYTKNDHELISRSHFTIYQKDQHHIIKDGITSVQDRPSKQGTLLNGEPLEREAELKNGDRIRVSDIDIIFEV